MDQEWTEILADYKKAKFALWCPKGCNQWSRDEETGYYYMWKAYHAAKSATIKDHLIYARILVMMSHERRNVTEYTRLGKYVQPALEEYRRAVQSGQNPTQKELERIQWEYDFLSYQIAREQAPYDEQEKLISGYEKLIKFGIHDSKPIFFAHTEDQATLKLQYYSEIATFLFRGVDSIHIDVDPLSDYILDFYCYRCFHDKNRITFDIGFYKIICTEVLVESVETVK